MSSPAPGPVDDHIVASLGQLHADVWDALKALVDPEHEDDEEYPEEAAAFGWLLGEAGDAPAGIGAVLIRATSAATPAVHRQVLVQALEHALATADQLGERDRSYIEGHRDAEFLDETQRSVLELTAREAEIGRMELMTVPVAHRVQVLDAALPDQASAPTTRTPCCRPRTSSNASRGGSRCRRRPRRCTCNCWPCPTRRTPTCCGGTDGTRRDSRRSPRRCSAANWSSRTSGPVAGTASPDRGSNRDSCLPSRHGSRRCTASRLTRSRRTGGSWSPGRSRTCSRPRPTGWPPATCPAEPPVRRAGHAALTVIRSTDGA